MRVWTLSYNGNVEAVNDDYKELIDVAMIIIGEDNKSLTNKDLKAIELDMKDNNCYYNDYGVCLESWDF